MSITVVTVADKHPTHDYLVRGFHAFQKSLSQYGHTPLILGWGAPWRGLGSKPKLLKQAIESGQIATEYLIFADAFDVAFLDKPERFVDEWQEHYPEARILWNAERSCFPNAEWAQYHPDHGSPYRYLNSGLSIGRTADYLQVLTEMQVDQKPDDYRKPDGSWHHENDQEWFMEKFLFGQCAPHELKMELDWKCALFQTMSEESMDHFELESLGEKTYLCNKITDGYPMAVHWNGNAKTSGTMEPILARFDLL